MTNINLGGAANSPNFISLPSEYQKVAYIEGTGTQYINTNIIPTKNTQLNINFMVLNPQTSQYPAALGTQNNSNGQDCFALFLGNATSTTFTVNGRVGHSGNICSTSPTCNYNTIYHVEMSFNKLVLNTTVNTGSLQWTTNLLYPMYLFVRNYNNSPMSTTFTKYRLYACQLYNNDIPVRDFIPCRRLSDNELGLYDLVSGTFFTNQGTGTFLTNEEYMAVPSDYQQVEYLQNSGTQYIDTGFTPNFSNGFKIEIDYAPTTLGKRYCLISNWVNATANISCEINTSNQSRFYINDGNLDNKISGVTLNVNKSIFEYNGIKCIHYCNGTMTTTTKSYSGASNGAMYLFVDRSQRFSTFNTPLKIYACKIWANGLLIRDLVPCYRKSDNVAGFYDKANDVFYTNAGSGTFTCGVNLYNSLPGAYEKVDYIQSSGTQYINTNFIPSPDTRVRMVCRTTSITAQNRFFGCNGTSSSLFYNVYSNGSTKYAFAYQDNSGNWVSTNVAADSSKIHTFDLDGYHKIMALDDGVTYKGSLTSYTATKKAPYALFLFANSNSDGSVTNQTKMRLYECQIWDKGIAIRNFIPCIRISDSVVGLYDTVTRTFFENANLPPEPGEGEEPTEVPAFTYGTVTRYKVLFYNDKIIANDFYEF